MKLARYLACLAVVLVVLRSVAYFVGMDLIVLRLMSVALIASVSLASIGAFMEDEYFASACWFFAGVVAVASFILLGF